MMKPFQSDSTKHVKTAFMLAKSEFPKVIKNKTVTYKDGRSWGYSDHKKINEVLLRFNESNKKEH